MDRCCIWDRRLAVCDRSFGAKTRSCSSTSFSGSTPSGPPELDGISGGLRPCLVTRVGQVSPSAARSVFAIPACGAPPTKRENASKRDELCLPLLGRFFFFFCKDSMRSCSSAIFNCTWLHRHLSERGDTGRPHLHVQAPQADTYIVHVSAEHLVPALLCYLNHIIQTSQNGTFSGPAFAQPRTPEHHAANVYIWTSMTLKERNQPGCFLAVFQGLTTQVMFKCSKHPLILPCEPGCPARTCCS
jgi:hypothetical protein